MRGWRSLVAIIGMRCERHLGVRNSGYEREHCIEILQEYTRAKNIRIPSGLGELRGWAKWDGVFKSKGNIGVD